MNIQSLEFLGKRLGTQNEPILTQNEHVAPKI